MIVVGGFRGRNVIGLNGRFGVRPADMAVGGDFPNPFANDVDGGADDTREFVGIIGEGMLPLSGVVQFSDYGAFEHSGAADGVYTTTFTLVTWPSGGPLVVHTPDEVITTQFGASGASDGLLAVLTASLLAGTVSGGTINVPGVVQAVVLSLVAGSASGVREDAGAGVTLSLAASLLVGSASGTSPGNAVAPGAVMPLAAVLQPGETLGVQHGTALGALFTLTASLRAGPPANVGYSTWLALEFAGLTATLSFAGWDTTLSLE